MENVEERQVVYIVIRHEQIWKKGKLNSEKI